MIRRTTIEIDEELLSRAQAVLGCATMRATVEEALRRAAELAGEERERLAQAQGNYFDSLGARADMAILASDEMWR
jgi:Arc/MetJ family transcription regulator